MDKNNFSDDQKAQLRKCESVILKGTKGFFEMCEAFKTIDKEELWKGSHGSFPSYLKERWDMDASTVSHYIRAAAVLDDLKDCEKKPSNEGQCRELGKLTPDQRRQVWGKVLESEERPTGRLISDVAKKLGLPTKDEPVEEAPAKERTVLSHFASTVVALSDVADRVGTFDPADVDQVREFVVQCRSLLELIEKAIGGDQFTIVS